MKEFENSVADRSMDYVQRRYGAPNMVYGNDWYYYDVATFSHDCCTWWTNGNVGESNTRTWKEEIKAGRTNHTRITFSVVKLLA